MKRVFRLLLQLELITELLGSPTLEEMRYACEGAKSHMMRRAHKPPSLTTLYNLSSQATHEAVHLLCQMLVFDPVSSRRLRLLPSIVEQSLWTVPSSYYFFILLSFARARARSCDDAGFVSGTFVNS